MKLTRKEKVKGASGNDEKLGNLMKITCNVNLVSTVAWHVFNFTKMIEEEQVG